MQKFAKLCVLVHERLAMPPHTGRARCRGQTLGPHLLQDARETTRSDMRLAATRSQSWVGTASVKRLYFRNGFIATMV